MADKPLLKLTTHLFGLPYQFPEAVDPRLDSISPYVGKNYAENIMLEAPVCTIIPGEASYLPGASKANKISTSIALLQAHDGDITSKPFDVLTDAISKNKDEDYRLYDFKSNYTDYINYVNMLCRAGATFLELNDTIQTESTSYSFQKYNWKNYKWNENATHGLVERTSDFIASLKGPSAPKFSMETTKVSGDNLKDLLTNHNYVQFYVDADVTSGESLTNMKGESMMKSLFDNGASTMKEIAFMANSGGMDAASFDKFVGESAAAMQEGVSAILGDNSLTGAIKRIIGLGGDVMRGNNIIIPDIYQSSSYEKSYQLTMHLKSPYGTKLGYFIDIFVPLMHLLALALPRQQSANSYKSPFLVKAYVDGIFTCNLGLVESIQISKVAESWSAAGLPTEVDVTISIADLYSELSLSPSGPANAKRFLNNSSLVEYLATNCGMNLTMPNYEQKWSNIVNTVVKSFTDVPSTVKSSVNETIYGLIRKMTSLY